MKYATAFLMLTILSVSLSPTLADVSPTLTPIDDVTLLGGSPLHIGLDGFDGDGDTITYSASSSTGLVETFIPSGNRSMRISVAGFGDMVFELFENRAPRVTEHIIALAQSGFYDGVSFHRVLDDFMIQGGDPTGTGSGGSTLGEFDDQFHVDLQHNGSGVLSMAKTSDDTNDSQFFITEVPTRWLDYNHSIFGQLVEGESVRQAISNVPVPTGGSTPITPVIMDSVTIFDDNENGVLMLSAPEGATGAADITVTADDGNGNTAEQTFHVTVQPDTFNSHPFLADIDPIVTVVDTPAYVQLEGIDVEGDVKFFGSGGSTHGDLSCTVDQDTGLATIAPSNGLTGEFLVLLGTTSGILVNGEYVWDTQIIPVSIFLPILGDTDGDHDVDSDDCDNLKSVFGLSGDALTAYIASLAPEDRFDADLNDDGAVDLSDFVALRDAFDDAAEAPPLDAFATPEPATMTLVAFGALAVLRKRRKR
jgi:large repetitive protein